MDYDLAFEERNTDEKSYKEFKEGLIKLKNPNYKNPLVNTEK
ncbi:hypothetical protein [Acetivibrio cellulolyticus]|nr:hypothetical protein [Acetivibrio cellulolyticus]